MYYQGREYPDWFADAGCAGKPQWFSEGASPEEQALAKACCATCAPVVTQSCLDISFAHLDFTGIFAGLTGPEREELYLQMHPEELSIIPVQITLRARTSAAVVALS